MAEMSCHKPDNSQTFSIGDYWPLIVLTSVSALAGLAVASGFGNVTMTTFMHGFMGVFLIVFALLKLFDIAGFQSGFSMYDLLASRVDAYGYIYPFLELGLGLSYLAFFAPTATYTATIVLFLFGALGVVRALRNGLNISCPCMGNILKVPLSTVTLTEDLAMVGMAALLLIG